MWIFNNNYNKKRDISIFFGYITMFLNKPYKTESSGTVAAREAYEACIRDNPDFVFKKIPGNEIHNLGTDKIYDIRYSLECLLLNGTLRITPDSIIEGSFTFYFFIGFCLFLIGLFGLVLLRTNIISLLLSIELMLLGLSFCFILVNTDLPVNYLYDLNYMHEPAGYLTALSFLGIAASESAIGLALIVLVFKQYRNLHVNNFGLLRG